MKCLRGEAHSHRLRHKRTPGETEGNGAGFETQECEENSHQCWRGATGHKGTGNKRPRRSVRSPLRSDSGICSGIIYVSPCPRTSLTS